MNSILPVYSAAIIKWNCLPEFAKATVIDNDDRSFLTFALLSQGKIDGYVVLNTDSLSILDARHPFWAGF